MHNARYKARRLFAVDLNADVVCRARHMFLKVSQTYHVANRLTSLRPSRMEAKGVAVLQRGIGDGASEGSSSAEAGYRKRTG
jgi:hypothetical protein